MSGLMQGLSLAAKTFLAIRDSRVEGFLRFMDCLSNSLIHSPFISFLLKGSLGFTVILSTFRGAAAAIVFHFADEKPTASLPSQVRWKVPLGWTEYGGVRFAVDG